MTTYRKRPLSPISSTSIKRSRDDIPSTSTSAVLPRDTKRREERILTTLTTFDQLRTKQIQDELNNQTSTSTSTSPSTSTSTSSLNYYTDLLYIMQALEYDGQQLDIEYIAKWHQPRKEYDIQQKKARQEAAEQARRDEESRRALVRAEEARREQLLRRAAMSASMGDRQRAYEQNDGYGPQHVRQQRIMYDAIVNQTQAQKQQAQQKGTTTTQMIQEIKIPNVSVVNDIFSAPNVATLARISGTTLVSHIVDPSRSNEHNTLIWKGNKQQLDQVMKLIGDIVERPDHIESIFQQARDGLR